MRKPRCRVDLCHWLVRELDSDWISNQNPKRWGSRVTLSCLRGGVAGGPVTQVLRSQASFRAWRTAPYDSLPRLAPGAAV